MLSGYILRLLQLLIKVARCDLFCIGAFLILLVTSCACSDSRKPEVDKKKDQEIAVAGPVTITPKRLVIQSAVAYLNPVGDSQVQGKVTFEKKLEGIQIIADVDGLNPGKHGFHIHEHGDCGEEGASAAGAHFDPMYAKHSGPDDSARHVGDLGNLVADEHGHAHYERVDHIISLEGEHSIIGRSVIVHADPDDYTTQPAGASGARISCGIIEVVSTP